ncbi:MAG: beta-ketoacyl-ACP synthase [Marinicella sp.]|nr:beta-ketoacyl-ACP synthase [Xanthomonadales bacterium]
MRAVGIQSFALSCALGNNLAEIWQQVSQGATTGMKLDKQFLFEGSTYLGRAHFVKSDLSSFYECRVNQFLASVALQLDQTKLNSFIKKTPERLGVILGTSTSGVDELEIALAQFDQIGVWTETYQVHHQRMANVSDFLADYLGAKGPVMSVSTACSSSAKALLSAQRWLNQGICDAVVVGGVDVLCQLTVNGFNALGALSAEKSLPFSANRQGINIGEAAALFLLTRENAPIKLLGGAETSDAHHISAPDPDGQGAIDAMNGALYASGLQAEQIDYVNLHGTATSQNDAMESIAVNKVFGSEVWCSSTKSMTGHTLGAAGALEIGLCALSMSEYNINGQYLPHVYDGFYDETLEPLNLVKANNALGKPQYALSNSFAFGGSNAALILGAVDV